MTPTLSGRMQTRVFLAVTAGLIWTAVIAAALPRPAGLSDGTAYRIAVEALALMTAAGLGWELLYHVLQQGRWDKDWPSLFALVTVLNEGVVLWFVLHATRVIDGNTGFSSPALPFYASYVATTWLAIWLFAQGPIRVLHVRWRFEGGEVFARRQRSNPDPRGPSVITALAIPAAIPAPRAGEEVVEGITCRNGHFCHPSLRYCLLCGDQLRSMGVDHVFGVRPPVGVLILADGTTHVVDRDLLLTRSDGSDGSDGSDALMVKPVGPRSRARGTARIRICGWTPVAYGVADAISVIFPGGYELPMAPGVPVPLIPGAELLLGGQRVWFESPYQTVTRGQYDSRTNPL